ncbi:MAG TPA: FAD-dependent monooxygenase [Mycolicibacillus parakoreensis]|nr:FAD-dependent monooxygenase [Mycolicibacillus parakoreensis]
MDTTVLVVGAGPTGLTAACRLAAAGVGVRVVDAAGAPATTSRALALQPRGVEVLARTGVLGELRDRARQINRLTVFVDGRELATLRLDRALGRWHGPGVLVVSQAEVEAVLRARLAALGVTVEFDRPLTGLTQDRDAVTAQIGGQTVRCAWLIGADGARSTVRTDAEVDFPGMPLIEHFLLADVHATIDRSRDATVAWLRDADLLAAFPLPGADLWRLMAPAPEHGPTPQTPEEVVGYLAARLDDEAGGRVGATEWTSVFRIQRRLAARYRTGRVLLAGDAAHIHSPLGGQGLNTGIGDAENLAWKLALVAAGRAGAGLLDSYEAERRPVAEDVLASTSQATMTALGRGWAARILRDRVAVPLLNRGWVQRLIAAQASQLKVSYRHGPLGGRARRLARGPRPGDRVPNATRPSADGATVRLHEALGAGWVLVGDAALADVARARLGVVTHLPATEADSLLVRPDAHLGWRGRDRQNLRDWLDRVLGTPAAERR